MSTLKLDGAVIDHEADWIEFRKWIDGTHAHLKHTWVENDAAYTVLAVDGRIWRTVGINKDAGDAQTDFEASFKSLKPLAQPLNPGDQIPLVALAPREGSETIQCSVNFCDPCTWYIGSQRVTEDVLTDSGDGLSWQHPGRTHWIDMYHGRVFDEDVLCTEVPHGYAVEVTVDDVVKTPRAPFADSGGDYTIDYATGTVTFASSQAGHTVKATYSYADDSRFVLKPSEGRCLDIDYAEVDVSVDVVMNDTICFEVYGYVQVFAPQFWDGYDPPGPYPTNTLIPLTVTRYKTIRQLKQEAIGVSPKMPALSSTTARGNNSEWVTLPFRYGALRRLYASRGMELRIRLENNIAFEGDNATGTLYCISRAETEVL